MRKFATACSSGLFQAVHFPLKGSSAPNDLTSYLLGIGAEAFRNGWSSSMWLKRGMISTISVLPPMLYLSQRWPWSEAIFSNPRYAYTWFWHLPFSIYNSQTARFLLNFAARTVESVWTLWYHHWPRCLYCFIFSHRSISKLNICRMCSLSRGSQTVLFLGTTHFQHCSVSSDPVWI